MIDDRGAAWGGHQIILPPNRQLRLYQCRGEARRPNDCEIIFSQQAYQRIMSHLSADTTREHGGLLIGYVQHSADATPPTVVITNSLPAQATQGTPTSLTFTEETWLILQQETDQLERLGAPARRIGWYHSHPNLGIFLSRWDLDVCSNFGRPDHVALVVDPVQNLGGFFVNGVEGYRQRTPQGFWEQSDLRGKSIVTWRNVKEVALHGELMHVLALPFESPVEDSAEQLAEEPVEEVPKLSEAQEEESGRPEQVAVESVAGDSVAVEQERPPDTEPPLEEGGDKAMLANDNGPAQDTLAPDGMHSGEEPERHRRSILNLVKHPFASVRGLLSRGGGVTPATPGAQEDRALGGLIVEDGRTQSDAGQTVSDQAGDQGQIRSGETTEDAEANFSGVEEADSDTRDTTTAQSSGNG
jgi:proteasome lid subunit RPN8/RPN11